MEFAWRHWMVPGLGLCLMELVVPGFFITWFGPGVLRGLAVSTQIAPAGDS